MNSTEQFKSKEEKKIQNNEIMKSKINELVDKMGFPAEIEVSKEGEESALEKNFICNIKTEDSSYLIGQHGINLQALQHIARIIIRKQLGTGANFILDVNSYRQEKNKSISSFAKSMANQAVVEKKAMILRPMSPYERRLVHLELSENEEVTTESIGEGEERRIIIKPRGLA